jgi:hypothetical protein
MCLYFISVEDPIDRKLTLVGILLSSWTTELGAFRIEIQQSNKDA